MQEQAPYLRIAEEISARIRSGELRPGDRVSSTREITRRWGVAMATATKALATLRQQGLVEAVPGAGTVVSEGAAAVRGRAAGRQSGEPGEPGEPGLSRERIVAAAVAVADTEGLAALSMRRLATGLGVTTMALYRHVPGKDELVQMMADSVFGTVVLPAPPPAGWRPRLEAAARAQWALYRRHPWLAQVVSFTRPLLSANALALGEWVLRSLDGPGLDPVQRIHIHATLAGYVRGIAVDLEPEAEETARTGIDDEQWMGEHLPSDERFPLLAAVPKRSLDLDSLFEFGLERLLDGFAALVDGAV